MLVHMHHWGSPAARATPAAYQKFFRNDARPCSSACRLASCAHGTVWLSSSWQQMCRPAAGVWQSPCQAIAHCTALWHGRLAKRRACLHHGNGRAPCSYANGSWGRWHSGDCCRPGTGPAACRQSRPAKCTWEVLASQAPGAKPLARLRSSRPGSGSAGCSSCSSCGVWGRRSGRSVLEPALPLPLPGLRVELGSHVRPVRVTHNPAMQGACTASARAVGSQAGHSRAAQLACGLQEACSQAFAVLVQRPSGPCRCCTPGQAGSQRGVIVQEGGHSRLQQGRLALAQARQHQAREGRPLQGAQQAVLQPAQLHGQQRLGQPLQLGRIAHGALRASVCPGQLAACSFPVAASSEACEGAGLEARKVTGEPGAQAHLCGLAHSLKVAHGLGDGACFQDIEQAPRHPAARQGPQSRHPAAGWRAPAACRKRGRTGRRRGPQRSGGGTAPGCVARGPGRAGAAGGGRPLARRPGTAAARWGSAVARPTQQGCRAAGPRRSAADEQGVVGGPPG